MKRKTKTEKVTLTTIAKSLEGMATKTDLAKISKSLGGLTMTVNDLVTTVDNLAISTNKGFENTVSKKEFSEFKEEMTDFKKKTEVTLFNLDGHARTTNECLNSIEKTLEPLMIASGAMQRELRDHDRRISHVERKIGLTSK